MYMTLIEPAELAAHTDDPNWVVLDCRFDLARPAWGEEEFTRGHVPNALYAHLDRDLSSAVTPTSGRHPLPPREAFSATLGRWGVDENVQIVAYDQGAGAYASRLWWLARWAGHTNVAVLNGGFAAWQQQSAASQAGLPVSKQPSVRRARVYSSGHEQAGFVTTAEVAAMQAGGQLRSGESVLVDARAADRFAGQNETLDPVAGHIPGARNHPFLGNLDAQGRFLPPATLRSRWLETLRGQSPSKTIAMCGSGVTACHNLLALEVAGLTGAGLYAGSWSEWIRDAAHPVER
jgi:thiosulfate/3-mercaptopyruvate sulfurtransferase